MTEMTQHKFLAQFPFQFPSKRKCHKICQPSILSPTKPVLDPRFLGQNNFKKHAK